MIKGAVKTQLESMAQYEADSATVFLVTENFDGIQLGVRFGCVLDVERVNGLISITDGDGNGMILSPEMFDTVKDKVADL